MLSIVRMSSRVAICLFRNDLRYHDNEVLALAHKSADFVLPLYCFDSRNFEGTHHYKFPKTGNFRTQFLLESIDDLRKTLIKHGSNLMIFHGKPEEAISMVIKSLTGFKITLILQTEVTKEETDVEKCLQIVCQETKATYITIWGLTLYHKEDLVFKIDQVPDSYTEFRKHVEEKMRIRSEVTMPEKMKPVPVFVPDIQWGDLPTIEALNSTKPIPCFSSAFPFNGGETAALQRIKSYFWDTNAVAQYKETRNGLIGSEYSTKFSPWLAHGCLSPRRIHWELEKYELKRTKNQSTYWVRFELLWRDYFKFVSMKYGDRIFYSNGMKGKSPKWKKDMELFTAWQMGRTGIPFVDANMRELLATGWMSNRGRQNVASFLVKDLLLDWRLGAEWFESLLLDHDVCSNYGNWNYIAGIGNDPRENRKFNMIKQSMDYDLEGNYICMWVPELKEISGSKIHSPWTLSLGTLSAAKIRLGDNYPNPVVVAPEWSRHQRALKDASHGNPAGGSQRGIDFYFKNPVAKNEKSTLGTKLNNYQK